LKVYSKKIFSQNIFICKVVAIKDATLRCGGGQEPHKSIGGYRGVIIGTKKGLHEVALGS